METSSAKRHVRLHPVREGSCAVVYNLMCKLPFHVQHFNTDLAHLLKTGHYHYHKKQLHIVALIIVLSVYHVSASIPFQ